LTSTHARYLKHVKFARWTACLLPYFTREEAEQLGLDGYNIDTFSSDCDEFVDEFGTEFEA
jgi:hypothetical protein